MLAHSATIRIAGPRSAVWALVGDPASWPRWAGEIEDVRTDAEIAVGTSIRYRYRGKPVAVIVSGYEEGRLLEIADSRRTYDLAESIALDGGTDATDVSITMRFEPTRWWAKLAAPLFVPVKRLVLGRPLRRTLRALRAEAERPAEEVVPS